MAEASQIRCSSVMVVPYQWILENIEKDPKTLSSKMILFRGVEVFRVALKTTSEGQTLIFMAVKLNKLGIKVREVFYGYQKLKNSMEQLKKQDDEGTLQVFSVALYQTVFEKTTFSFQIHIEGTVADFSYQLADRLLKNQLWMAVKKLQWTDIDLIVKNKKFSAHKCILAARSPVFATEFAKDGNIKKIVFDIDVSTIEQFLYFLYTGESNRSLANEQLFKLASCYQLTTLASLCKNALGQVNAEHVMRSIIKLHPTIALMPSLEYRPTKDTELYFDPNTSTLLADWTVSVSTVNGPIFFEYRKEKLFTVHVTRRPCVGPNPNFTKCGGELRLIYTKHRNSGYDVAEALYSINNSRVSKLCKMEQVNVQEQGFVVIFVSPLPDLISDKTYTISFRIKIASSIDNYRYELMDATSATQIWSAAINRHLTDVEIFVGYRKFGAHRVVLSARSSVFDTQLNKDTHLVKSSITISETVDPDIFQHFLEFLYTGTLKISACNKQLTALAESYEVETLKKLCQVNRELDAEELTNSILAA